MKKKFMQKTDLNENKIIDIISNVIIICAGVTLNTALSYFKYPFLLLSAVLIIISAIIIFFRKKQTFFRNNCFFILFGLYTVVSVSIKHILILLDNEQSISIITGYGEVICILFGLFFFQAFSKEKVSLLLKTFVFTFAIAFIIFGKNTLYDVGNVCRTIGAYDNPNILAMYAWVALCLSLYLFHVNTVVYKYLFTAISAISVTAIIYSSSRAMILGIIISTGAMLILFFAFKNAKGRNLFKIRFKEMSYQFAFFGIVFLCAMLIFYPKKENAVINNVVEEQISNGNNDDESNNSQGSNNIENNSHVTSISRIINDAGISMGSSVTNNLRFMIWKRYFDKLDSYALWGNSELRDAMWFEESGRGYVPHNIYLSMLYKYGIFGFGLFVALLLKIIYDLLKSKNLDTTYSVLLYCLGGLCVYGLLHEAANMGVFWCVVGMVNAYNVYGNYEGNNLCEK